MDAVQSVHTAAFNIVASDVQIPAATTVSMPSEDQSAKGECVSVFAVVVLVHARA